MGCLVIGWTLSSSCSGREYIYPNVLMRLQERFLVPQAKYWDLYLAKNKVRQFTYFFIFPLMFQKLWKWNFSQWNFSIKLKITKYIILMYRQKMYTDDDNNKYYHAKLSNSYLALQNSSLTQTIKDWFSDNPFRVKALS